MTFRRVFQLIGYSEEIVDGVPIHVFSNSLPVKAAKFEPAGYAFHAAALRLCGFSGDRDKDKDQVCDEQGASNGKEQSHIPSSDPYSSKKSKKKAGADGSLEDHYALLNLGHLRYLATEDQIRKSYRDAALKYHPDKQAALLLSEKTDAAKQAKKNKIENHFKSIQEAYEILIDPAKRRIYDSTDEFDDKIPTDCVPQDFFKVFGPAFMRNGRWSVNQPVPSLGDESTPMNQVDSFYNFWYSFKSWREFPHEDEHDLEQAESRDHKRWMERQNAKLSEKAKKEDYVRIRSLVDSSYKRDPRIIKRKEEEKAAKKKKKGSKYLVQKQQEEEAARIAEEERRQKEEDDKQAAEAASQLKKLREKEKKLLRKERSRLRTITTAVLSEHLLNLTKDDVESLCVSLEFEKLKSLCDKMEGKEGLQQAKLLKHACGFDINFSDEKEEEEKACQNGSMEKIESMVPNGSVPMFERMEKPCGKEEEVYGSSTPQRPENSAKIVNSKDLPSRSTSNSKNLIAANGDYSSLEQEKVLIQALKTFPKEVSQRCDLLSAAAPGATMNPCKTTQV